MNDHLPSAYLRDPYRTSIDTRVVAGGPAATGAARDGGDEHGPWVELADTVLYPEGGGQPSDRGTVDGRAVVAVQRVGSVIRHVLAAGSPCPAPHAPVRVELDWARRFDHMQQHTAQHVLTAVAADRFGWPTTAFHLGPDTADIELDVSELRSDDLRALEAAVAAELRAAHPVHSSHVDPVDIAAGAVRTRGLPDHHRGPVRLVTIGTLDVSTCGGTHVASTAEVEALTLLAAERMRGGVRLVWVAGGRVRRRMAQLEARAAALRRRLGAADDALVDALDTRLARLAEADRLAARLAVEIAQLTAERIVAALPEASRASGAPSVLVGHPTDEDPPGLVTAYEAAASAVQLLSIARAVAALRPDRIAVVAGGMAPDGRVVIAAAPPLDDGRVRAVADAVFAALDGRGGGRSGQYQGTTPTPERVASAAALLAGAAHAAWRGDI